MKVSTVLCIVFILGFVSPFPLGVGLGAKRESGDVNVSDGGVSGGTFQEVVEGTESGVSVVPAVGVASASAAESASAVGAVDDKCAVESTVPATFAQFSAPTTIKVETFQQALDKAADPRTNQKNIVYQIASTGELFFQVDKKNPSQIPGQKEQPAPDGTAPVPEFKSNGIFDNGIFDKVDRVFDKIDQGGQKYKDKLHEIGVPNTSAPQLAPLIAKASDWVAQKVVRLEEKVLPGMVPVTPCLDSTFGDGGSISFTHGTTITTETKTEGTVSFGYLLYLQLKSTTTNSLTTSYSSSVKGSIPAGYKGRIYIKNAKILSNKIIQKGYSFKEFWESGEQSSTEVDALDYTVPFEYHLLTSDKHAISCDGTSVDY